MVICSHYYTEEELKMKTYFRWCLIFSLILTFVSILTINSYAQNNDSFSNLETQLGIYAGSSYGDYSISDIPTGKVIEATVVDPSKMGGCLKGDRVKLMNMGNGDWTITRLADGSSVNFMVQNKDGVMKVAKTGTFGQKVRPTYYEGLAGRSGLGVRVSYVNFSDDDYSVYGVNVDVEPDDAAGFGINYTYFVNNNFSFELSADYIKTDVKLSALGLSGDAGEIKTIPVLFSGRVHADASSKVSPYLAAGLGYFFNDIDTNNNTAEFIYGPGAKFDVDDSFGFFLGGGIEIFLSNNIGFNLDLKYIWTEAEASVNKAGFTAEDLELNPFVAGLGLKYYF
jgi:outer membrane protein